MSQDRVWSVVALGHPPAGHQVGVARLGVGGLDGHGRIQPAGEADPEQVLARLEDIEVSTWEYSDEDGDGAGDHHMGPMAEDFTDAFELGPNDRSINSINADGVAFAAIKGPSRRLAAKNQRIEEQDDRIAELESETEELRARLGNLESRVGTDGTGAGTPSTADD